MSESPNRAPTSYNPRPDTGPGGQVQTDYPAPAATPDPAPAGKGPVRFFGLGLSMFAMAVVLAAIFLAVIIYFAVMR